MPSLNSSFLQRIVRVILASFLLLPFSDIFRIPPTFAGNNICDYHIGSSGSELDLRELQIDSKVYTMPDSI